MQGSQGKAFCRVTLLHLEEKLKGQNSCVFLKLKSKQFCNVSLQVYRDLLEELPFLFFALTELLSQEKCVKNDNLGFKQLLAVMVKFSQTRLKEFSITFLLSKIRQQFPITKQ